MHRLIKVHIKVPDGSSRIGSLPNPRRNTSKEFFETFRIGDKADTCYRFVSSPSPLFADFMRQVETKPSHVFLTDDPSSINCE